MNTIDVIALTVQENVSKSSGKHMHFRDRLAEGLNNLSIERTWSAENGIHVELSNLIGTKAGRAPNCQSIYVLWRRHVGAAEVEGCQWAFHLREKGFVGVSARFEGVGRVLIAGSHLPTPKHDGKAFTQRLMRKLESNCIPEEYRGLGKGTGRNRNPGPPADGLRALSGSHWLSSRAHSYVRVLWLSRNSRSAHTLVSFQSRV